MPTTKRENRLQFALQCAETFLLYGEKGDMDPTNRGVRLGVLANRVSRRYRFTDDEAIALARRAFSLLIEQGYCVLKDGVFKATMKLARREPHEGLNVVLRARQWRALGYRLPACVPDSMNVKNLVEDQDTGEVTYEVLRD